MANIQPTAANIISSLGVKGAIIGPKSGEDASKYAGFVPVLGEDGKISADLIPSLALDKSISPISNVVVVDPGTLAIDGRRSGSVIAPFKNISEAAQNASFDSHGRCAILLMPGIYQGEDNVSAVFSRPSAVLSPSIAIIGIGECELDHGLHIEGVSGGDVLLQDIRTNESIEIVRARSVTCLGRVKVGGVLSIGLAVLNLSSESSIESTDSQTVKYLSKASLVGYGDETAASALDRLNGRRIRVANISYDGSRFSFDMDSYSDLPAEVSAEDPSREIYDMRQREKILIDGINSLVAMRRDIVADSVTAGTVKADVVDTNKLKIDSLVLGGYKIAIDAYGYLVVLDADTPIVPPSGIILISDSAPGDDSVYAISVHDGRLKIANADEEEESSHEVVSEFSVVDSRTREEYVVKVLNGRIMLFGQDGTEPSEIAIS